MKEIDLKEQTVFYNTWKRIYVAAKKRDINQKEILAVPIFKCPVSNKWLLAGSRLISYRVQDLCPIELDSPYGNPLPPYGLAA